MEYINYKAILNYFGIFFSFFLLSACECSKPSETTTEEPLGKKILNDRHLRSSIDDSAR